MSSRPNPARVEDNSANLGSIKRSAINRAALTNYIFRYGRRTITFLNGKNTGRAGVIEKPGANGEPLHVTSVERTLIDVIVRPQYAGGIHNVLKAFKAAKDRVSVEEIAMLLATIKHLYPSPRYSAGGGHCRGLWEHWMAYFPPQIPYSIEAV